MGVILSCKSSQCHQCRTSGEERTGSGKGIGFPPHLSNGKENQDGLKAKLDSQLQGHKTLALDPFTVSLPEVERMLSFLTEMGSLIWVQGVEVVSEIGPPSFLIYFIPGKTFPGMGI